MHEAAIASNILDMISRKIDLYPRREARTVTVIIGAFRNVETDTLQFAFDALKVDRAGCAHCELIVHPIPVLAHCQAANHLYEPNSESAYRCSCGSGIGEIIRGEELDIVSYTLTETEKEQSICTK